MKRFKEPVASRYQLALLPLTVDDFVPAHARSRVIADLLDAMDCTALENTYRGGGAPAYHPRTLLKILVFAYSEGIRSSRNIAVCCTRDLHYLFLAEMSRPDHRTLCTFRRKNGDAIAQLFRDTVLACKTSGLVLLEHVAVDGTKIEADVSSKETYNRGRVEDAIAYTEACIAAILGDAEAQDARDDQPRLSLDAPTLVDTPASVDTPALVDTVALLDTAAPLDTPAPAAAPEPPTPAVSSPETAALVRKLSRRKERARAARERLCETGGKAQGATDLESRVMKTPAGNRPAYNAQAAVDGANQIIVAAFVTQSCTDGQQMAAMLPHIVANTGAQPGCVTADCGYNTLETLYALEEAGVLGYLAEREDQKRKALYVHDAQTDVLRLPATADTAELTLRFHGHRTKEGKRFRVYRHAATGKETWVSEDPERELSLRGSMHERMTSASGKAIYRLRQQVVEPVFGHLKTVLRLRRFLLRGLAGARIEYLLACAAHNLKKYAHAQVARGRGAVAA